MRMLIVEDCSRAFLDSVYAGRAGLEDEPFEVQLRELFARDYAVSAYYQRHLQALGSEARATVFNALPLQRAWYREQGFKAPRSTDRPMQEILAAQVRHYRPDVVYIHEMFRFDEAYLRGLHDYTRLVVGQIACPLKRREYRGFDLVLSSLPNYVDHFRAHGMASELFLLAFEHTIPDRLGPVPRTGPPLVHIGGLGPVHAERNVLLERLCRRFDLQVWGYEAEGLAESSSLRGHYQGFAWGLEAFRVMGAARIVPNCHVTSVAGEYANNCRLYEATGVGALLITDRKKNLGELFDIGREVIAYDDFTDCEEKVAYYLQHTREAAVIAEAGQRRTLRDHTYQRRMAELEAILRRCLGASAGR